MNKSTGQGLILIALSASVILLLGYYILISAPLTHIRQLCRTKAALRLKKSHYRALPKAQDWNAVQAKGMKSDWFGDLFVVLEFFQIKVKSLRVIAMRSHLQPEGVMLQVDLQGPYSLLQPFFAALLKQGKRALILDYVYQTKNGLDYVLTLNLFMLKEGPSLQSQPEGISLNEQTNPFCLNGRPYKPALFNQPVPIGPLDKLKLVGSLQQGQQVEAFLQTKEGSLIGVHVGEALGTGTVISILPDQVLIRIPPQSSLMIKS